MQLLPDLRLQVEEMLLITPCAGILLQLLQVLQVLLLLLLLSLPDGRLQLQQLLLDAPDA